METRKLRKDLTGKKFGMLTVILLHGRDNGGRALWLCKCDCGDSAIVEGHNLQCGHSASCGCVRYTEKYGKNIIGKRFGRAIALRQFREEGYTKVECLCDCGNKFITHRLSLVDENTVSCGCYHKERIIEASFKHGLTDTRIHGIWCDMRSRCNLKTNHNYHGYGGRGIKVCDSWEGENGFKCFYEWSMRNGYTDKLTIDRIDNNGMYSPDNCRWTDMKTQCNNTRRNVLVEYKGKTKTIGQWAVELNLKYSRIYSRIAKLGWSAVDAFEKP